MSGEAVTGVLDEEFEIVEPGSLPHGGTHHGVDGYVALMQQIGALFDAVRSGSHTIIA